MRLAVLVVYSYHYTKQVWRECRLTKIGNADVYRVA